jgi:hypothetical protein
MSSASHPAAAAHNGAGRAMRLDPTVGVLRRATAPGDPPIVRAARDSHGPDRMRDSTPRRVHPENPMR